MSSSRFRNPFAALGPVAKGVLAITFVFGGYIFAVTGLLRAPLNEDTREITAVFANTAELDPGAPVRIRGVRQGKVASVEPTGDGRTTTVRIDMKKDAPRIGQGARADLRWRLVLGGNYAIDLDPGRPVAGASDDMKIGVDQTTSQVEVDEVLSVLQAKQRAGIRSTLTELPKAFLDPQAPAEALETLSDVAPDLGTTVRSLRGREPDRDLRRLVASTAATVAAVDASTEPIRDVIEGGAVTLRTTAAREADIQQTIVRAAAMAPRTRATLRRLDRTLALANPTLDRLVDAADDIQPTAASLRPTVFAADRLLGNVRPLVRRLRPAVTALRAAAREGVPLLDGLAPSLERLSNRILPDLALVDKGSKRPTFQMLGPTVASFNAVAGNFDPTSFLVALDATAGDPKVDTAGCQTYFTDLKPDQIVKCEGLLNSVAALLGIPPARRTK